LKDKSHKTSYRDMRVYNMLILFRVIWCEILFLVTDMKRACNFAAPVQATSRI